MSTASRSLPFVTRVVNTGARDIIARDRARAQKYLASIHPHGPVAFHNAELRKRRRTLTGGNHAKTGTGTTTDDSIDVTDAGTLWRGGSSLPVGADKVYNDRRDVYGFGRRRQPCYPVHLADRYG
jgi:hypothetical protein